MSYVAAGVEIRKRQNLAYTLCVVFLCVRDLMVTISSGLVYEIHPQLVVPESKGSTGLRFLFCEKC